MAKKKTQSELLQEIVTLLEPINNLSRYYISQINAQIQAQNAEANAAATVEKSDE